MGATTRGQPLTGIVEDAIGTLATTGDADFDAPLFQRPFEDPVLIFGSVMVLILLAPLLFRRLRIPGIVGLILAGAVVGPSGLNLLARDFTFELLGQVGLLYLMFVAGLSMELNQFIRLRNRSLAFGAMSFFIPQVIGIALGMWLLGYGWAAALLLGSIVGSHTLLAYPIAKRIGIVRNRAITMATGGTLVTDGVALAILAGVVGAQAGEMGAGFWVQFLGLVGAFVTFVVIVLPRLGRWFFRSVPADADTEYIFLLAVLFSTAYLSGLVGLAPIVGAFLAGLLLNRLVPDSSPLMSRVSFFGDALFIPFFLISVGMLVDFAVLFRSGEVWATAAVFTGVVVVGKLAAAKIAQWVFGHTAAEGWTIGGLTVPQAAATLAVTLVGFRLELFSATDVNAVVLLILVTCVLGPWLVERFGRQVALAEETQPIHREDVPQRILVPLANPDAAEAMMDVAFMIRDPGATEPVYPLTVALEGPDAEARVAAGERMLGYAVIHAAAAEVPVIPVTRVDVNVAGGVLRALRDLRISAVVIGWNAAAPGLGRTFGPVVDQILDESPQQAVICHIVNPLNTLGRLVLALAPFAEREPGFDEAIQSVKRLARQLGLKLVVVTRAADRPRIEARLKRVKPDLALTFADAEAIVDAPRSVAPPLAENDLFVLMSTRRGRISWHPHLERVPRNWVSQSARTSLMVVFPSEIASDAVVTTEPAAEAAEKPMSPTQLLVSRRTLLGLTAASPEAIVERLLRTHYDANSPELYELLRSLQHGRQQAPIEVTPGVVLLHTHTVHVAEPTLFLATLDEGMTFPKINKRVYVVFVLLSPRHLPPKTHLTTLASIARLVQDPGKVKRMYEARSMDELQEAIGNGAS
jgi:Kef-type K+ transport system membrane component KefB/mannitol/fructose-specific phosphotransferase system IIA component (Ntr-type)